MKGVFLRFMLNISTACDLLLDNLSEQYHNCTAPGISTASMVITSNANIIIDNISYCFMIILQKP